MLVCCFSKSEAQVHHILIFCFLAAIVSVPLIIVVRRQPCKMLKYSSDVNYEVTQGHVRINSMAPTEFKTHKLTFILMYLWKNRKYCYVDAGTIHNRRGTFDPGEHVSVKLMLPCRGGRFILKIRPESYYSRMRSYCHQSRNRQCSITCPDYVSKYIHLGEPNQERCNSMYSIPENCAMNLRRIPVRFLTTHPTPSPTTTTMMKRVIKPPHAQKWRMSVNGTSYKVGNSSEHGLNVIGWVLPVSIVVMFLVGIIMLVLIVHKIFIQRSIVKLSKTENNLEIITQFYQLKVPPINSDSYDSESDCNSMENQSIGTCNELASEFDFPR